MIKRYNLCLKFTSLQLIGLGGYLGEKKGVMNNYMGLFFFGIRKGYVVHDLSYAIYYFRRGINFCLGVLNLKGLLFFVMVDNKQLRNFLLKIFLMNTHYWYSGILASGLVSNFQSFVFSKKMMMYSNIRFVLNKRKCSCVVNLASSMFYNVCNEAFSAKVPGIGLVDSDLDVLNVYYPIVVNNDNFKLSFYFLFYFYKLIVFSLKIEEKMLYLKINRVKYIQMLNYFKSINVNVNYMIFLYMVWFKKFLFLKKKKINFYLTNNIYINAYKKYFFINAKRKNDKNVFITSLKRFDSIRDNIFLNYEYFNKFKGLAARREFRQALHILFDKYNFIFDTMKAKILALKSNKMNFKSNK